MPARCARRCASAPQKRRMCALVSCSKQQIRPNGKLRELFQIQRVQRRACAPPPPLFHPHMLQVAQNVRIGGQPDATRASGMGILEGRERRPQCPPPLWRSVRNRRGPRPVPPWVACRSRVASPAGEDAKRLRGGVTSAAPAPRWPAPQCAREIPVPMVASKRCGSASQHQQAKRWRGAVDGAFAQGQQGQRLGRARLPPVPASPQAQSPGWGHKTAWSATGQTPRVFARALT